MTRQEFDTVSEKMRPKLLGVVRSFGRTGEGGVEAEDIVQEALATLWRLFEDGYPVKDAESLAVKITKTACVANYRRRRLLRMQPLRGDAYEGGSPATAATDLSDSFEIRRRMYAGLTGTERTCLDLRNVEGLTLDEIAEKTGKPKDSVKTTISAARRKMLEQLKKEL